MQTCKRMQRLGFLVLLLTLMSAAPVGAISITRGESHTVGLSGDSDELVMGAESVTIDADLDSETEVEKAIAVVQNLVADVPRDHRGLLELGPEFALPSEPASSRPTLELDSRYEIPKDARGTLELDSKYEIPSVLELGAFRQLRDDVAVTNRKSVRLSKTRIAGFAQKARTAASKVGRTAYASLTDSHRLTLMVIRTISASGAVFVGISVASHLPIDVQHYFSTLTRTVWTGFMSAGLVMFADLYSDAIIKPWKFKKFIDDSAGLRSFVDSCRGFLLRGRALPRGADKPALGVKLGLYTDQFVKSLGLEFLFVYASTLTTDGFSAANSSMVHVIPNLMGGGLGQMTFDQSISIIADAREARIEATVPPGPEREAQLKKVIRWRDSRQAVNSLAQVWLVMVSKYGNEFANVALHVYAVAGVITRVAIEMKSLNDQAAVKRADAKDPQLKLPFSAPPRSSSKLLRCEAVFG